MFNVFSLKSSLAKTAGLNPQVAVREQLLRSASDNLGQASSAVGLLISATEIKGAGIF